MKVIRFNLVAAMAIGSLLLCNSLSSAQDTNTPPRRRGAGVEQRVERMTTELQLNDEQKAKVKALLEKETVQRREIFNLPREERRDKMRALMEDETKQLKLILTPAQLEKWQKLREQMRARRPGGSGQTGGPAPAPAPESKVPETKTP